MEIEYVVMAMLAVVQGSVMWALKELYEIRQEVSGVHARFAADIEDHERRLHRLERRWDTLND